MHKNRCIILLRGSGPQKSAGWPPDTPRAPRRRMRAARTSGVSPGRIGTRSWRSTGPVSVPSSTTCTVHPDSVSPASSARRCGSSARVLRQERRVDVQDASAEPLDELGREDAHVTGQADQVGARRREDCEALPLHERADSRTPRGPRRGPAGRGRARSPGRAPRGRRRSPPRSPCPGSLRARRASAMASKLDPRPESRIARRCVISSPRGRGVGIVRSTKEALHAPIHSRDASSSHWLSAP